MCKSDDLNVETEPLVVIETYDSTDDIPTAINFFGKTNGAYFKGLIIEAGEMTIHHRPSIEWFQAFGLKPYVETETE